jgi:hypothetical protein
MHLHEIGCARNGSDRRNVTDKVEIEISIERRIDDIRRTRQEKRIAIGWRADDSLGCDVGASAWSVLNDELLAKTFGQPLAYQTCGDVDRSARWEADDDAHWPRRIGLCPS